MRNCAINIFSVSAWVLLFLYSTAVDAVSTVRRERPPGDEVLAVDSGGFLELSNAPESQACTPLTNHGSYFSAKIKVGSEPGKSFDVVADTGSNSVIVTSCQCAVTGTCSSSDRCIGDKDSKTLHVNKSSDGKVPIVVMAFGSGQIEAMIGSDTVSVGSIQADLSNQLLLMVDRALDLKGEFEGILGLGIPEAKIGQSWTGKHGVKHKGSEKTFEVKGFLEEAKITRFSMCFQDSGNGTLRLNVPALTKPLSSVGVAHWGLDFRGISVGSASTPAKFCIKKEANAETPCGAIPDSGTTLIMGPKIQLKALYEDICDAWPRCKALKGTGVAKAAGLANHELLELVLANCSGWVNDTANGLNEMPELHFHLRGKGGSGETTLAFKGSDYVEIGEVDIPNSFASRTTLNEEPVDHFISKRVTKYLSTSRTLVCLPAMGAMDYNTQLNGPVWILGTPLFYAFQVSYDLGSQPPSMQIAEGQCETCGGGSMAEVPSAAHVRQPRRIKGKARGPSQPLSGPL